MHRKRESRCQCQEFLRILTREVRDRSDRAFATEPSIRNIRDIAHVNAGADHHAARRCAGQGFGDEVTDRREDERAVQRHRGRLVGWTGPCRTDFSRKAQGLIVAWCNERVDVTALVYGQLRDDMRGCAEPVDPESGARPCHSIRAVSDQAGTQKRRGMVVVVLGR